MAGGAHRVGPVLLQHLPQGAGQLLLLIQGRAHPAAAAAAGVFRICSRTNLPRFTGDVRVAFDVSVRTLAWVRIPPRLLRQLHADKLLALHAVDAVMLGELFVDEREIGIEQVENAVVFADDRLEEQLALADHRLAKVAVEVGEHAWDRARTAPACEASATARQIPAVNEADLGSSTIRLTCASRFARSWPFLGQIEQLIIGHAVPQEIRKAAGQLEFIDVIACCLRLAPGGSSSTRNRKCGDTSTRYSAARMHKLKALALLGGCASYIASACSTSSGVTGRR